MPQIIQAGSVNTTAIVVPDLYVQILPPQNTLLNGVPTNVLGVVGTATWGPVGVPTIIAQSTDLIATFGTPVARKYDMGTQVSTAILQGASNFRCVRVTDGTDTAASVSGPTGCITFTALFTGSFGSQISVSVMTGSKLNTWKLVVQSPGNASEVFDNIGGTGNAFWLAAAAAINSGTGLARGPSQFVIATAGAGTTAPTAATYTLTGGTDGASAVTAATLVGLDVIPRKGMYALRSQGCSVALLADADDPTQYVTQAAFGLSEGIYMILTGPAGDNIANAVATKATAGLDSYGVKLMFGDWLWWADPYNQINRLVSPQGFIAGREVNLSPEQSSLNKPIYGVIGSQKLGLVGSAQSTAYADADLQTLFQAGIDVITNPAPGGSYWAARLGHNTSSNSGTNGDNYTRLTNYISSTLAAGMGVYIGQVINTALFANISATLNSYLQSLLSQGILGSTTGALPWTVTCNASNNPIARTSLGYVQADVAVQYQGINEKFFVNLQGGTTVTITTATQLALAS